MITFLLLYFSIYTLAHYYLLHKGRKAGLAVFRQFGNQWRSSLLLAVIILLLVAAPIIIRVMERAGIERGSEILAYISYTWMGFLFLFISLSVFTDLVSLPSANSAQTREKSHGLKRGRKIFLTQVLLVLAIYCYGFYEARAIRTNHLIIESPRIPKATGNFRLVHISDVHLGLMVGKKRLARILEKVGKADPDLLVSTGDLVDSQTDNLEEVRQMLAEVKPPLGKLAVTGNHEFYAGLDKTLGFTRAAGFQVLRNRTAVLAGISFTGVDDPTATSYDQSKTPGEVKILKGQAPENFRVLLKHRPSVIKESRGFFDLQLSGHTHKGQIFPFNLITRLFYPRSNGLTGIEEGGFIYHSRGSGTWGPPIRFLSPPEVTVIDLQAGEEKVIKPGNK
ncbi:MAG: metallophosphoesterase [Desulfurivibrionaceae bacterium]